MQYKRSGASWEGRLSELSPNKRWLVVLSYTGEGPYGYGPFGEEKVQKKGKIYLDIYDTKSEKPGGSASTHISYTYSGGEASSPRTMWIEDRYLMIPIYHGHTSLIFWETPRN